MRTVEEAVRNGGALPAAAPAPTPPADAGAGSRSTASGSPTPRGCGRPGLLELEELLADCLDTRVGVQMGAKRGKVTIDFADLEDLERIYRLITGEG